MVGGLGLIIGDALEEASVTTIGFTVLAVGVFVVVVADALARVMREPGEFEEPEERDASTGGAPLIA